MRLPALTMVIALLAALVALSMTLTATSATTLPSHQYASPGMQRPAQQTAIDDNDDTRVRVQLVVSGGVAALVVVAGTGAYLLRRKLGLTTYTPDANGGGHH